MSLPGAGRTKRVSPIVPAFRETRNQKRETRNLSVCICVFCGQSFRSAGHRAAGTAASTLQKRSFRLRGGDMKRFLAGNPDVVDAELIVEYDEVGDLAGGQRSKFGF
jgi:hypothetical protein